MQNSSARRTEIFCLVVDNQRTVAQVFQRHLEDLGFRVDCAYDVDTARRLIAGRSYRAAVVDLNLTVDCEWEGLALIERLGRRASSRPCLRILLTGESGPSVEREAYRCGADVVLTKPCSFTTLDAALETALEAQSESGHGMA